MDVKVVLWSLLFAAFMGVTMTNACGMSVLYGMIISTVSDNLGTLSLRAIAKLHLNLMLNKQGNICAKDPFGLLLDCLMKHALHKRSLCPFLQVLSLIYLSFRAADFNNFDDFTGSSAPSDMDELQAR